MYLEKNVDSTTSNHIRIVLGLTSGTTRTLVATLQPVLCPKASELLPNYDEQVLVNNFKFVVMSSLDTQSGQAGQHSVYTEHIGKEVMYCDHLGTFL